MMKDSLNHGMEEMDNRADYVSNWNKDSESFREHITVGKGTSYMMKKHQKDVIEVLITFELEKTAEPLCLEETNSRGKVSLVEDDQNREVTLSVMEALKSFDWLNYGLAFNGIQAERNGTAIIEFTGTKLIKDIDILIRRYKEADPGVQCKRKKQNSEILKIMDALKLAMDQLNENNPKLFLDQHTNKIKMFIPELSRSISSLIISSNDIRFKEECADILNIVPAALTQENIEFCLTDKMCNVIKLSDRSNMRKQKRCVKRKGQKDLTVGQGNLLIEDNDHLITNECHQVPNEEHEDTAIIENGPNQFISIWNYM